MRYTAPVDDWLFLWNDVLRVQERALPGFDDLGADLLGDLAAEAARFHEQVLFPLGIAGDREGARFEDGAVRTPAGFREAWDRYRAAGWPFLGAPADLGGGGMPPVIAAAVGEMRGATAHSFMMYGSFCIPAATMLRELGEPWMKQHLLPRLAVGDWTATMCMTEAQAGSDLRQLATRATQEPDGTWRITGDKIFISGGDHDLAPNIVHIVLAKVPGPRGTVGDDLSDVNVFVVPKLLVDPDTGEVGERNAVGATAIEHKMGIEGSATCAMRFEGAVGYRIAGRGAGTSANMAAMFLLMNTARLGIALTSVGYAEVAYQNALDYARERLSGRAPDQARHPDKPADPLVVHPDIRRLLLSTRSFAEGGRALAAHVALWQSISTAQGEGAGQARSLVEFLTPVMKAYFSDRGFQATVDCQQVLGGHGYTKDHPFEQWVRNTRIGQIYEGANGIQARDFVRRWIRTDRLEGLDGFHALLDGLDGPHAPALAAVSRRLRETAHAVTEMDAATALAGSYDLVTAYGIVAVGWAWATIAQSAASAGPDLARSKEQLAAFWMARELPLVDALCARVSDVAEAILDEDLL